MAISDMWSDLRKVGGLTDKSSLLANCEAEVQELMRQIDIMVQGKRAEWEKDRQTLTTRLQMREQEALIQKTTIDQKHEEIGKLKHKMLDMEQSQTRLVNEYENQLSSMKSEVSSMRREYEKLKRLHSKYLSKDKERLKSKSDYEETENRRLQRKIDDYKEKCKSWELQKRSLSKNIDTLESQLRTLEDKCDFVEQQAEGYKNQLDRRRDMLESTETNLRSQVSQLEGQLERSRDTVNSQDTQIVRLRAALDEAVVVQRKAIDDKDAMDKEIKEKNRRIRQLEDELSDCSHELEGRTQELRVMESKQHQLTRTAALLEQSVNSKDSIIGQLGKETADEIARKSQEYLKDLNAARDEIRKRRKTETALRNEIDSLREQLSVEQKNIERLNEDFESKARHILNEIEIEEKLRVAEENHKTKLDSIKDELTSVMADMHKRNVAMATLSDQAQEMERKYNEQLELMDRKKMEINVINTQLEALRLENQHLRKNPAHHVDETEQQLQQLQESYNTSLATIEKYKEENRQLRTNLAELRGQMHEIEVEAQNRIKTALRTSEQSINDIRNREERTLNDVRATLEKENEDLRNRLDTASLNYESQVEELQHEITALMQELNRKHENIHRIGQENQAMSQFVDGVDRMVHRANYPEQTTFNQSFGSTSVASSQETYDIDAVTARFVEEQDVQTRELERKLDEHILGLKHFSSDRTTKR